MERLQNSDEGPSVVHRPPPQIGSPYTSLVGKLRKKSIPNSKRVGVSKPKYLKERVKFWRNRRIQTKIPSVGTGGEGRRNWDFFLHNILCVFLCTSLIIYKEIVLLLNVTFSFTPGA